MTPVGGGVALANMMLGEVSPGGVGVGLYGILVLAILTVFLAGLMVGRTPEYLGKKIGRREVTFVALYILAMPTLRAGRRGPDRGDHGSWQRPRCCNPGPHGLSEILYAYASAANNNGSAFAGFGANTAYQNTALGVAMLFGRFVPIVLVLGLAGSLAQQRRVPPSAGTLPTTGPVFIGLLLAVVVIIVALTFMPALALSPIAEALSMSSTTALKEPSLAPARSASPFHPTQLAAGLPDALRKLNPAHQWRSPVMFVVWVGSIATTLLAIKDPSVFSIGIAAWLWLTVVFANLAEAVAESRGRAQASALRAARTDTMARRLLPDGSEEAVPGPELRVGDLVVVEAGQIIPGDGDVVEGVASVDESAITGESAPVIRESGGDRSAVTGGTKVLSDRIVVRITAGYGESFLDRMIALVEGSARQKTPNEIALNQVLAALTLIFLLVVVTLQPFAAYSGQVQPMIVLIALLVCLIPTTIGALLSAIGIAGMDRLVQRNVLAMSGRAVEAAGDVDVLLLDKTGTITLGNRQAFEFVPVARVDPARLARRRATVEPGRRDPGGQVHRRPGQGRVRPARPEHPARHDVRPVQRRHPHVGHRPRRRARDPQGCRGGRHEVGARQRRAPHRGRGSRSRRHLDGRRHPAGGRRAGRHRAPRSPWAWCTSRTWSRRGCATGSPSCAPWASAR